MVTIDAIVENVFIGPLTALASRILELLPQILIATVLLAVSYAISYFAGVAVKNALYKIKIDSLIRVKNRRDTFGATSLAAVYSHLTKWSLFVLFAGQIVEIVTLGFISGIFGVLLFWLSRLVLTAVIAITGLVIIDFFTLRLHETKTAFMRNTVSAIRIFLIIVVVFASLEQLGLRLTIAENIFLMSVGAALLGVALAVGISFGLALKEDAKRALKLLRKKLT